MDRCIKTAKKKEAAKSNVVYLVESIQRKTHSRRQRFHSYKALVSLITSATFYSLIWHSFKTAFSDHILAHFFFLAVPAGDKNRFSIYTAGGIAKKQSTLTNIYERRLPAAR
jgi:hypothetical protein